METHYTDISNTYLELNTLENNYIIAGTEFGDIEVQILIFSESLYGLFSSGLLWHERFAYCLLDMVLFL